MNISEANAAARLLEGTETQADRELLAEKAGKALQMVVRPGGPNNQQCATCQERDRYAPCGCHQFRARNQQSRCPRCGGLDGVHGLVHVRHGNGGGHNEPCPNQQVAGGESR